MKLPVCKVDQPCKRFAEEQQRWGWRRKLGRKRRRGLGDFLTRSPKQTLGQVVEVVLNQSIYYKTLQTLENELWKQLNRRGRKRSRRKNKSSSRPSRRRKRRRRGPVAARARRRREVGRCLQSSQIKLLQASLPRWVGLSVENLKLADSDPSFIRYFFGVSIPPSTPSLSITSPRKAPQDKFHVPIYLFQPNWPV